VLSPGVVVVETGEANSNNRRALRVLLLQIRERVDVEQQEQRCFIERCSITPDKLDAFNLVRDHRVPWDRVQAADCVIIGGAGIYSATKDYAFSDPLADTIQRIHDAGMPLFGACWGHQFVARVLGGTVVTDDDRAEVGTFDVDLTAAAADDPVFKELPPMFAAHMGHHDHVTVLPTNCVELARTDLSPNQAYRVTGKPIYGTQFHSELSRDRLIERVEIYKDLYMPKDDEFAALKRNPTETPHAESILERFLNAYVI
jgi:GMP synthase (glutamine-hydrolysing)